MTIQNDVKSKIKEENLKYEKEWKQKQQIQFIKGLLFVVAIILISIFVPLLLR